MTRCGVSAISLRMIRIPVNFYIVTVVLFSSLNLMAADAPLMLQEMAKDEIEINAFNYPEMNPLKRIIQPKYNSSAVEYEYHAWSEKDEYGNYPVDKWELVGEKTYELARYWDPKYNLNNEAFYGELTAQEREVILYNLKNGVLRGGLTKPKLSKNEDSERFFLISTRKVNTKEKLIPSFVPPTTIKPNVSENEAPAMNIDPNEIQIETTLPNETPKTSDAPTKAKKEKLYGIPVPGKRGYIYSPAPDGVKNKWIIDVHDYRAGAAPGALFAPGSTVGDPYTGEEILVP